MKVLLRTGRSHLCHSLARRLANELDVVTGDPGVPLLDLVNEHSPDIILVEPSPRESPADLGISSIKKACPHLKVIFASRGSTPGDAEIVEEGIFYYTVVPDLDEAFEVIRAAAAASRSEKKAMGRWTAPPRETRQERRAAR